MPRLDEASLRRKDFVPGTAVELADGQEWQLRRPVLRFLADDSDASGFQACLAVGPDDDFAGLMKARERAFGADGQGQILAVVGPELAIGKAMLLANYDLTPEQLRSVLQFGFDEEDDPVGAGIREAVLDVAFGVGPKPSPGGTESSPTPPGP